MVAPAGKARLTVSATLLVLVASGCSSPPPPAPAGAKKEHPAPTAEKPVITGALTREQVLAIPNWQIKADLAPPLDVAAAQGLAQVPPGATVHAIIGTWCSDSRREIPRLYQAMDVAGARVPFAYQLTGVDRDKKSPGLTIDVAYVPTFIVTREGKEVGRIIESAPNGIEKDLLSLLDGTRSGVITGRQDLAKPSP